MQITAISASTRHASPPATAISAFSRPPATPTAINSSKFGSTIGLRPAQSVHLGFDHIDDDHFVSHLGKACSGDTADIPSTVNNNFHGNTNLKTLNRNKP